MRLRALLPVVCVLSGCVQMPDRPPAPLAIGQRRVDDGTFELLHDGDLIRVVTGVNGLDMVQPCLVGAEMEPVAPLPHVTVTIDGILVGALLPGGRPDLEDGVLWDLRVPFTHHLCCYTCRTAELTAQIEDAEHRDYEGRVQVVLARAGCPDEAECCSAADECSAPFEGPVCGADEP